MTRKPPLARIANSLSLETVRLADELAARHDRSRSWIVAEASRQYAAGQRGAPPEDDASRRLGRSRLEPLRRDVALSPKARVLETEELVTVDGALAELVPPRSFPSYDALLARLRQREAR